MGRVILPTESLQQYSGTPTFMDRRGDFRDLLSHDLFFISSYVLKGILD